MTGTGCCCCCRCCPFEPPERAGTMATAPTPAELAKLSFVEELSSMVYGFAGDKAPVKETMELLNDMVLEFVGRMTVEAVRTGRATGLGFGVESLVAAVRSDPRKRERVAELLQLHAEIKKLRDTVTSTAKDSKAQQAGAASATAAGATPANAEAKRRVAKKLDPAARREKRKLKRERMARNKAAAAAAGADADAGAASARKRAKTSGAGPSTSPGLGDMDLATALEEEPPTPSPPPPPDSAAGGDGGGGGAPNVAMV